LNRDIGQHIPEIQKSSNCDHVVSIFTLEEIAADRASAFFNNMAKAVHDRSGSVHIFTQHPSYALQQDIASLVQNSPNEKFQGHEGYFDARPTTYTLAVLNSENGVTEKPMYHHKPFGAIINGLAEAGLYLREILEIPAGVIDMPSMQSHQPKRGDVPRFLYLRAQPNLPKQ